MCINQRKENMINIDKIIMKIEKQKIQYIGGKLINKLDSPFEGPFKIKIKKGILSNRSMELEDWSTEEIY